MAEPGSKRPRSLMPPRPKSLQNGAVWEEAVAGSQLPSIRSVPRPPRLKSLQDGVAWEEAVAGGQAPSMRLVPMPPRLEILQDGAM